MSEELLPRLAEHPFLTGMKEEHLRTLSEFAMEVWFQADEVIFRKADVANRFYLLENGSVALEAIAGAGNLVLLQKIHGGDVLGWSWMFAPFSWNFDARALEPTRAIFLYGTRVMNQMEEDTALGYEVLKRVTQLIIQRLQNTRKQLVEARGSS